MKTIIKILAIVLPGIVLTQCERNVNPGPHSEENLVAFYPFYGNANDETSNGYDGIVHGATLTTDRFGTQNSAYSYDGEDDFIELPTSFDFEERTYSAWFNSGTIHEEVDGNAVVNCDHDDLLYGTTKIRLRIIDGVNCVKFLNSRNTAY